MFQLNKKIQLLIVSAIINTMNNKQLLIYSGITIVTIITGLGFYLHMTDHLKPKKDDESKD
jgi:hypothetical protein